ncbi:multiple epidermal growth factor-like domains protein 9 [Acanthopagrus latus]|uniref:multiple epidermal growth factor-like domains protein 9 n=1 Tax=Acanthopagrus latus TaxID=8177 RepID=UPI00187BDF56|nr:multiple epidermal growth factor-like domains protein 9 [Acanthopagrus latus]
MRLTSLMMYISAALLVILYVYIGFSEAAPRISPYDASPISRKSDSASDTWETFHTDMPRTLPESSFALGPLTGLTPSPAIVSAGPITTTSPVSKPATTLQPPTTDPTTTTTTTTTAAPDTGIKSATNEQISPQISRSSSARKRSTDAQTSLFAPEKTLQTMVSMVSQRTANDAWAADNIGTSVTSVENSQEGICNCSSGGEGILDPEECDQSTGQCSCMSGYTGLQCEDCEDGHFINGTNSCLPCACDSFGAVNHLCDSSGICLCKTGVYGPKCDECYPGFFRFSSTGCQPCQCHNHTNYCHPQSGLCVDCDGNTQGSNCEECKPGFYRGSGTALNEACAPCPCSNSTSTGTCHTDPSGSPVCDLCLPRYSGSQCDKCSAGFYKASEVCVPCDCSGNADPQGPTQLCDPDTGRCLRCINNTTGLQCQLCAPGFIGDAKAHNCTRPTSRLIPTPADTTTTAQDPTSTTSPPFKPNTSLTLTSFRSRGVPAATSSSNMSTVLSTAATTQLTSLSSPTDNTTAALTEVSWTQFNIIILAVIILVVLLLLGFVGGVYTYREYQNRKLNAPFWTIELKEDNISFSSYHDSIPNADVSGLLEDEANEVAPNGQLALTTQGNCYKA